MLELLSDENLAFVKAETERINDFAQEHFDGHGFTDITPVGEKPVKTIDKLIDLTDIEKLMTKAGLQPVSQFHMQGVGLLQDDKAPAENPQHALKAVASLVFTPRTAKLPAWPSREIRLRNFESFVNVTRFYAESLPARGIK